MVQKYSVRCPNKRRPKRKAKNWSRSADYPWESQAKLGRSAMGRQSRGLGNADAAGRSARASGDGWFLQEDRTPGYGEAMGGEHALHRRELREKAS